MKRSIVAMLGLMLLSCSEADQYEKIVGEWNCSQWIVQSTGVDMCKDNAYFNFKSDKTYTSKMVGVEESGTYSIAEGKLYSTPEGQMEIGVEISKLNNDTLQLVMSRSGHKEILTMLRKKQ